jgi:hypothetical protein
VGSTGTDRPDPVIARLANGVLTLSSGDGLERYGDTGGVWYGGIIDETFRVVAVTDEKGKVIPGRVRVRSLGIEVDFSGVKQIVANGGLGNDVFDIGAGIDAKLNINGGGDSDTITVANPALESVIDGGKGGVGYTVVALPGKYADYLLSGTAEVLNIAPVEDSKTVWAVKNVESLRFADRTIAFSDVPRDNRALAGPIVAGEVHFDMRTFSADGTLLQNCNIIPDGSEPTTSTDSRGAFNFSPDLIRTYDRDGNGVVDFRDGMLVVGSLTTNGVGTMTSVTDSITGSNLGFPLVGLPGGDASLLTTIKYATLLRWRPDQTIAGLPVTPELINKVLPSIMADAPSTFTQDDFDPYIALSSVDPTERAKGIDNLRFSYVHMTNILTVMALFREFGLDYENEAAWSSKPDASRADQLEVVAFSAYSYAIATRFGANPLDRLGRPAVAPKFDPLKTEHLRAVMEEILAKYPTKRLFALEPEIVPDFVAVPSTEQATRVHAAIQRSFGGFLDNLSQGLELTVWSLQRRVVEGGLMSDIVPALGTQLVVASVAGLKRLIVEKLATALVVDGQKSYSEFVSAYNPLFFQPKPVESATQPITGWISLAATGSDQGNSLVTATPENGGEVTLRLDYSDDLGALAAPDYGLAVRYRLGGTAREGIDYTIDNGGIPIASILAGQSNGKLVVKVSQSALTAGDRFLQVELLSADSGMRVDGTRAVVTIALGANAISNEIVTTGDRTSFVPHQLVTAEGDGPAVIRAPAGGSNVVLRGVNGRADLFVVGDAQSAGIPFIENINVAEGDRLVLSTGDLIDHRRANQLSDENKRTVAQASLEQKYGIATIKGLDPVVLDSLIASEIEAQSPLGSFVISQLNTMGGFLFDITGKIPVAMVSDYSPVTGDKAWASLSVHPEFGFAGAFEIKLSGGTSAAIPENSPPNTPIGTLTTIQSRFGPSVGPFTYELVPGVADNVPFAIEGDKLLAVGPLNFESRASYEVRVRSTGVDGSTFDATFLVRITDVAETPYGLAISNTTIPENLSVGSLVGELNGINPDLGSLVFSLSAGAGSDGNSHFEIVGNQLRSNGSFDFEGASTHSVRVRATNAGGLFTETVFQIDVGDVNDPPSNVTLSSPELPAKYPAGKIIGSLSTADQDPGDACEYSLVAGDGDLDNLLFAIEKGNLVTRETIDFATRRIYTVRIRSTDPAGAFVERAITVSGPVTVRQDFVPGSTFKVNLGTLPNGTAPTGEVTLQQGDTVIARGQLDNQGMVLFENLQNNRPGKYTYQIHYQGDEKFGATVSDITVLVGTRDQRVVEGWFEKYLGRPSLNVGLKSWSNALGQGTSENDLLAAFKATPEYLGKVVDHYYKELLGRSADAGGKEDWISFLQSGRNEYDLGARITLSEEYRARHTSNEMINQLFDIYLGRHATPSELAELEPYPETKPAMPRRRVESLLARLNDSGEHREHVVDDLFRFVLERQPSGAGKELWANALTLGLSATEMENRLFHSAEYLGE